MKNSEIAKSRYFKKKIYPLGYPNIQKLRLYPVSIFNEKYNYFLRYLVFFRTKKDPKLKDQKVRDQVSTTFSEAPQWDLTFGERISCVALVILALFQLYCCFFRIRTHFFDFGNVFGCHALSEKKKLDILKVHFFLNILKEKFFLNLREQKSSPDPKNYRSSDQ